MPEEQNNVTIFRPENDAPEVIQYRPKVAPEPSVQVKEPVCIEEHNDDPDASYDDGHERNIAIVKSKA